MTNLTQGDTIVQVPYCYTSVGAIQRGNVVLPYQDSQVFDMVSIEVMTRSVSAFGTTIVVFGKDLVAPIIHLGRVPEVHNQRRLAAFPGRVLVATHMGSLATFQSLRDLVLFLFRLFLTIVRSTFAGSAEHRIVASRHITASVIG